MKKSRLLLLSIIGIAISLNNIAFSAEGKLESKKADEFKVATVNIEKIVESSPKINALKLDRKNKIDSLAQFIEQAQTSLKNETNEATRKTMEENYNKELLKRKETIDKDFVKKMSEIDTEITALIKAKAKKSNFDLILNKNTVIDGGTDITSEVIKNLK